jgi:hypothetical protein
MEVGPPSPQQKIKHHVTRVTLPCADRDYLHCRYKGDGGAMLIQSIWPAVGLLIAALPLIGAGIWGAIATHNHQKRADHWSQFGPARS